VTLTNVQMHLITAPKMQFVTTQLEATHVHATLASLATAVPAVMSTNANVTHSTAHPTQTVLTLLAAIHVNVAMDSNLMALNA
jgi:hypothetical protein